MSDPKAKRTYEHDALVLPALRLESSDAARAPKTSERRLSRYDDLELPDREKLVNKLIDHLKGL